MDAAELITTSRFGAAGLVALSSQALEDLLRHTKARWNMEDTHIGLRIGHFLAKNSRTIQDGLVSLKVFSKLTNSV